MSSSHDSTKSEVGDQKFDERPQTNEEDARRHKPNIKILTKTAPGAYRPEKNKPKPIGKKKLEILQPSFSESDYLEDDCGFDDVFGFTDFIVFMRDCQSAWSMLAQIRERRQRQVSYLTQQQHILASVNAFQNKKPLHDLMNFNSKKQRRVHEIWELECIDLLYIYVKPMINLNNKSSSVFMTYQPGPSRFDQPKLSVVRRSINPTQARVLGYDEIKMSMSEAFD